MVQDQVTKCVIVEPPTTERPEAAVSALALGPDLREREAAVNDTEASGDHDALQPGPKTRPKAGQPGRLKPLERVPLFPDADGRVDSAAVSPKLWPHRLSIAEWVA